MFFSDPQNEQIGDSVTEAESRSGNTLSAALFTDLRLVANFAGWVIGVGLLLTLLYGIALAKWESTAPLLWAAALLAAGAGVGFLFGIPRVYQTSSAVKNSKPDQKSDLLPEGAVTSVLGSGESGPATETATQSNYQQKVNTNLEEISDWLTKIIVGFGLIQLRRAPEYIDRLSDQVAQSFGCHNGCSHGVATAIVIFFSVVGFLFSYLMTRLYLQGAFARAERNLPNEGLFLQKREAARTSRALTSSATLGIGKPLQSFNAPIPDEAYKTLWNSDPHKGKAGGLSEANVRRLSATLSPIMGDERALCRVHLEVRSTDRRKPLVGNVVFHLHPTFKMKDTIVPVDPDGVARLDIISSGAFTVLAEMDNGSTKLELDLREIPGGTKQFYEN